MLIFRQLHSCLTTILHDQVDTNQTLPVTISTVNVLGASRTRRDFLGHIFNPLLSANCDTPYTLAEALTAVSARANQLRKFGKIDLDAEHSRSVANEVDIFHDPVSVYFDRPTSTNVSPSALADLAVYISVREKSRVLLKTGTDLGNTEGSAYGSLLCRNVLGGAESLNVNASLGTRTRSAYSVGFNTPIRSDPDLRWEIGGLASSTRKGWSSHEEASKGWNTNLRWLSKTGDMHELGYSGLWRQITGLAEGASATVRDDAGDSVKSSVTHTWTSDHRDNSVLPTRGYLLKSVSELAGWGPLQGDVAFWKSDMESQVATAVPVPFVGENGVTFTAGLRAGLLYPLALAGQSRPRPSRINDRFQLGGPTDVRGFRLAGLGPREGADAVGGDIYAAGSANLFFPLPRVGPERPLRLHAFINGGRLLALTGGGGGEAEKEDGVQKSVYSTMGTMFDGLPSTAAGIGIVYAHPVARFELNFTLPLVVRKGEEGRKGLQFGVGINFL